MTIASSINQVAAGICSPRDVASLTSWTTQLAPLLVETVWGEYYSWETRQTHFTCECGTKSESKSFSSFKAIPFI